jgi:hypothetical protein
LTQRDRFILPIENPSGIIDGKGIVGFLPIENPSGIIDGKGIVGFLPIENPSGIESHM